MQTLGGDPSGHLRVCSHRARGSPFPTEEQELSRASVEPSHKLPPWVVGEVSHSRAGANGMLSWGFCKTEAILRAGVEVPKPFSSLGVGEKWSVKASCSPGSPPVCSTSRPASVPPRPRSLLSKLTGQAFRCLFSASVSSPLPQMHPKVPWWEMPASSDSGP